MIYERIVPYTCTPKSAPRDSCYICLETPGTDRTPIFSPGQPIMELETPGIVDVAMVARGEIGCYYVTSLHCRPHYEILPSRKDSIVAKAVSRNIDWDVQEPSLPSAPCSPTACLPYQACRDSRYKAYFWNGVDLDGMVSSLELPSILKDSVLKEDSRMVGMVDPTRGSRGFSIGFTGGQCLRRVGNQPAEPVVSVGTLRYSNFFCELSQLVRRMSQMVGLGEPFSGGDPMFVNRRRDFAQRIAQGNILESLSFKCYIHEKSWIGNGSDRLKVHVDSENCPDSGWDGCGVAYQDYFCAPIGRWITMVAIGTSRKSVSDAIRRTAKLEKVVGMLTTDFLESLAWRREILDNSFCPDVFHRDHKLLPLHYQPTVHLSMCLESFLKLRNLVAGSVSRFLVVEGMYCFLLTNNSIRFHRFFQWIVGKGKGGEVWILPLDGQSGTTFTAKFIHFLVYTYGSLNGKLGKKREPQRVGDRVVVYSEHERMEEGCPRCGAAKHHPMTQLSLWTSLWWLNNILEEMDSSAVTQKKYKVMVNKISKHVDGVNTSAAQKLIMLAVMTGLLKDMQWMAHAIPNSPSLYQALMSEPYGLDSKTQIPQVIDLLHKRLCITPSHADHFICNYLKSNDNFRDVLLEGQHLYGLEMVEDGSVMCRQYGYKKPSRPFTPPPLESSLDVSKNGYLPMWVNGAAMFHKSGALVHLSDDKSEKQLSIRKSRPKPIQYQPYSANDEFTMVHAQSILKKNSFYVLTDPFEMVRLHLGTSRELVLSKEEGIVATGSDEEGWEAFPGKSLLNVLGSDYTGHQDMRAPRRCHVGLKHITPQGIWKYRSRRHAKFSLAFHLLLNIKSQRVSHWSSTFLDYRPEFLMLLRLSPHKFDAELVCCISRDSEEDAAIIYRMLQEDTQVFLGKEYIPLS